MTRVAALARLVHPFPSLLTSSATAAIASLAGAEPITAARLFGAMLGIQFAIGALNDVVDVPLDAIAKPAKPIPAGRVKVRAGIAVAGGGAVVGLGLSAMSGPAALLVGAAGLGLGWLYDLRLSRTPLSWLPLAIALPLLPIHAWLGATGTVPAPLVALVPIGILAGSGLALANGLVDVERDAQSGHSGLVVALGPRRTWVLQTALLSMAAALVLVLAPGGSGVGGAGLGGDGISAEAGSILGIMRRWGALAGCVALALGALGLASGRAAIRERGWELEAIGVAALGVGWLAGVPAAGS